MVNRFLVSVCLGFLALTYSYTVLADVSFVHRSDVKSFIQRMVKKHGFKRSELVTLFQSVKIRPRVMQSIRGPAEQLPWYAYQTIFINPSHIREGEAFWQRNEVALAKAEKIYGVPASIIVATIGVETKYGKIKGDYPVVDALSNIAFSHSPRAHFFRQELEEFLLLTREQHLDPMTIKGSYAGAIGQPQFMPSSYRHYAINFSGHRNIDLSNNELDIIGSIANYYKKHGWKTNQAIAVPAMVQKTKRWYTLQKLYTPIDEDDLYEYGIIPTQKIAKHEKVTILELKGYHGNECWVALQNFDVIKRYNPSDLYAMSVFQLSYYITEMRERLHHA